MSSRTRTVRSTLLIGSLALGTLAAGCSSLSGAGGGRTSATTPAPASSAPPASTSVVASPTATSSAPPPASTTGGGNGAGNASPATCRTSQLKVSLGTGDSGAGHHYQPIRFTNAGGTPCTIVAWPGVSYVAGNNGHQVGAAATREGGRGSPITLRPGETASASLDRAQIGNFPTSDCHPTHVRGLRIYPPHNTASTYVPLKGAKGCAGSLSGGEYQLAIKAVQPGANAQ